MDTPPDRDWIRSRLRAGVTPPQDALDALVANPRPAAVLIALVERETGVNVVLTRRNEGLRDHAGQISFPGGRIETDDPSTIAAALREAQEEIGLPPQAVEVVSRLPSYLTGTGFLVYPIVGFIDPATRLRREPREVAEIFEVPLSFVLDPTNHHPHELRIGGRLRRFCAMPYGDYYIWGATAGMLRRFYRLLTADPSSHV